MELKQLYKKLLNGVIKKGKKQKAKKRLNEFFIEIVKKNKKNPIENLIKTLDQIKPTLRLRTIRKSGQLMLMPQPLEKEKQVKIVIAWFILETRKVKKKGLAHGIMTELQKVEKKESNLMKKKENIYKNAVNNRGSLFIIK